MSKTLFILKRREDYNAIMHSHIGLSTGLYNSANFMNDMLNAAGVESHIEVVVDNNDINRVVTDHRPTHVVIEALWVVPSKFTVLKEIHPTVTWIIRLHSELPFLASEGMAMNWLGDYSTMPNVVIAANAPKMLREVSLYLKTKNGWTDAETAKKVIYLPNYYPQEYTDYVTPKAKETIDIGCFGAVRPLKNHLSQAIAAIDFANQIGKKLNFHINAGRIEMQGQSVLNNINALFAHLYDSGHRLINHDWTPRAEFLQLCASMDLGLQVSFSETFNIVAADLISQGVPVIGSKEIPWMSKATCADPTNSEDIVEALHLSYKYPELVVVANQALLTKYTNKTSKIWIAYFTA